MIRVDLTDLDTGACEAHDINLFFQPGKFITQAL